MSVLVQRPQMPGIIVLPRHSSSPSNHRNRPAQPQRHHTSQVAPAQVAVLSTTNKPSRRQRGQLQQPPSSSSASPSAQRSTPKNDKRRSHQPAHQVTDSPSPAPQSSVSIISGNSSSSSSATVSASHSPVLSSASSPVTNQTTPATTPPTSSPTLANSAPNAFNTPPRKAGRQHQAPKSAPNTPTPANSLPVPANRRRARSPRPTQKLPGLNLEELVGAGDDDSFPSGTPAKKNNKKVKALVSEPATWQQAALLNSTGALTPLIDSTTAVAHPSMTNPPSPTRTSPPKGSVFDIAFEHGLTHSITMPNLATPNRRTGGLHTRAPSVPSYSTFPAAAKPSPSLEALFSGLAVDSAPATPAAKATGKTHTRGQSVSSSLPPSTSLHARMAAAAASTPSSASRRERTLTGNTPGGYIKFAGASFQTAPDAMMLPRPAFGGMGMFGRRGSSQSGSSDEDSEEDERAVVDLSEEEETGVFAF